MQQYSAELHHLAEQHDSAEQHDLTEQQEKSAPQSKWEGSDTIYRYLKGDENVPKNVINVTVDSSVTEIADTAFEDCRSLTKYEIPTSVMKIGSRAFCGCVSLASVEMSSVSEIDRYAFYGCGLLVSVVTPSVTKVGSGAFNGCASLVSVEMPSLSKIGKYAFDRCDLLENAMKLMGVSVEVLIKNLYNELPLHRVCLHADVNQSKIMECLIQNRNYANMKDSCGQTALCIILANERAAVNEMSVVMSANPEATTEKDINGSLPLHKACASVNANLGKIQLLVDAAPETATEKDIHGGLPLHIAISNVHADLDVIKLLVDAGPEALDSVSKNNEIPLMQAMECHCARDIQYYLFSCHPTSASQILNTYATKIYCLTHDFFSYIKELKSPVSLSTFPIMQRNGWVTFVAAEVNMRVSDTANVVDECIEFIQTCDNEVAKILAESEDIEGRSAIRYAIPKIKAALQERFLFMGRYDIAKQHVLQKSAICVVVRAYDEKVEKYYDGVFHKFAKSNTNLCKRAFESSVKELGIGFDITLFQDMFKTFDNDNDGTVSKQEFVNFCKAKIDKGRRHEVAIKFMKKKDQFLREVNSRRVAQIDKKFVVGIERIYDGGNDKAFADGIQTITYLDKTYQYALVMPFADRNLDTIFRIERPDIIQIRAYSRNIGDAILHLHQKGIIHGDLKLQNIVRSQERLQLIDLDASARISGTGNKSYIGSKFSSGVLPPEMIARLNDKECEILEKYFQKKNNDFDELWPKVSPKIASCRRKAYSVKTFTNEVETTTIFGDNDTKLKDHLSLR